jgi:hypothetical protein
MTNNWFFCLFLLSFFSFLRFSLIRGRLEETNDQILEDTRTRVEEHFLCFFSFSQLGIFGRKIKESGEKRNGQETETTKEKKRRTRNEGQSMNENKNK